MVPLNFYLIHKASSQGGIGDMGKNSKTANVNPTIKISTFSVNGLKKQEAEISRLYFKSRNQLYATCKEHILGSKSQVSWKQKNRKRCIMQTYP